MSDTPNVGLPLVPENTLDPAAGLNLALIVADALIQTRVISMALSSPPGGESDGDMYIVNAPGSGAWADLDNYLVRYVAEGAFWQSYEPGVRVHFVLNLATQGFYSFDPSPSPGEWVLAAGLGDAPSDGQVYGRKNAGWQVVSLTLEDDDAPSVEVSGVTRVIVGLGLSLSEDTDGIARIDGAAGYAEIATESGAARTAQASQGNTYVRFTNASAKVYTFDDAEAYTIGQEFHGRNVGAGDLSIEGTTGMTINPPFGGSLVIPEQGTFTVKIVAAGEADLFGVTVETT
jgi:hypothetical protein